VFLRPAEDRPRSLHNQNVASMNDQRQSGRATTRLLQRDCANLLVIEVHTVEIQTHQHLQPTEYTNAQQAVTKRRQQKRLAAANGPKHRECTRLDSAGSRMCSPSSARTDSFTHVIGALRNSQPEAPQMGPQLNGVLGG
jgi:hypothetical protein